MCFVDIEDSNFVRHRIKSHMLYEIIDFYDTKLRRHDRITVM